MAKAKKSIFFCQNCGHEESKWLGQCPVCRQWNTFVEEKVTAAKTGGQTKSLKEAEVVALSSVQTDREERVCTGIGELDRVLGAGSCLAHLCWWVEIRESGNLRFFCRCARD